MPILSHHLEFWLYNMDLRKHAPLKNKKGQNIMVDNN